MKIMNSFKPPFFYDHINMQNWVEAPSTIHATNTGLSLFFQKYLYQRAMSVYEWKLPEEINPYYFAWVLFTYGYIGVFNLPEFGAVAQWGALRGYDLYYFPKKMLFNNPAFSKYYPQGVEKTIDEDVVLFNLTGTFTGIGDIVRFYSDMLSVTWEACGVNMLQCRTTNIFGAQDAKMGEEFKKIIDQVISGEPAVVTNKDLFTEDGKLLVAQFNTAPDFVAPELLNSVDEVLKKFDAEIGIPTANTKKKERLITGEVNSQKYEAMSRSEMWLENMQKSCKKCKDLLGIDISVDFRYNVFDELAESNMKGSEDNGI